MTTEHEKPKHTPTPWFVYKQPAGYYEITSNTKEYTLGSLATLHGEKEESNANFIVEACNNYERLKADLAASRAMNDRLVEAIKFLEDKSYGQSDRLKQLIAEAKALRGEEK